MNENEMQQRIEELERALSWLHQCSFNYLHSGGEQRKAYADVFKDSVYRAWDVIRADENHKYR